MNKSEQYLKDEVEWSASRVTTADNCLYAFKKIYFDKENTDNYFAYRGSAVHQIMEDYDTELRDYDIPLHALRANLIGSFEQMMDECPHEPYMYYEGGKKRMNHNRIIESLKKWKPLPHVKHVEREIKFKVRNYKFRAFLDVEREYEKLMVTGKMGTVRWHSDYKSEWSNSKYRLQQYLYMYAKELEDGVAPAGFEILEYKHGFKSVSFKYDKFIIKCILADIEDIIENTKQAIKDNKFPKTPKDLFFCRNLCRLCEHGRQDKFNESKEF